MIIRLLSQTSSGSGFKVADLTPQRINGKECVGFNELNLNYSIHVHRQKEYPITLQNFRARISIAGLPGGDKYLGEAKPSIVNRPIRSSPHDTFDSGLTLTLPLTLQQIEQIEVFRNGGDLNLSLELAVDVYGGEQPDFLSDKGQYKISQSEWLSFLKSTNYINLLLFEIPIPDTEENSSLEKAVIQLRNAKTHFVNGHYRQTVALCREALESLNKGASEVDGIRNAVRQYKDDREKMAKYDRELFIRQATINYAHLAHHSDSEGDILPFNRREASLMLGLTSCILSTAIDNHANQIP